MSSKLVLVIGGAGYIGSHMLRMLSQRGLKPIVLDNLSTGHRENMGSNQFIQGDIQNSELLEAVFKSYPFHAVMHFASSIEVGESVKNPEKYYENNVAATLNLLTMMRKFKISYFIFSSSAAVYGEPKYTPMDEKHPCVPINPYGRSKRMVEQILEDFSHAYDFHYISLRYFNAAGAAPSGELREKHTPETHLIPLLLQSAKNKTPFTIYGTDYPTPDGTCIRDFVHVNDICEAHYLALEHLLKNQISACYNLGTGQGHSIKEVITHIRQVTNFPLHIIEGNKRAGDPAILIADAALAQKHLGWVPRFSDLKNIIKDAWFAEHSEKKLLVF